MPDPTRDLSAPGRDAATAHPDSPTADHATTAHAATNLPVVPGFELLDEVGRGGMGVVYRARDEAFGRDVAVKLLQDKYPAGGAAARRFADEARITGQLQHPGIPAAYLTGTLADGRPFLAMKLIKGQTLDDLIKAGGPPHVAAFEKVCEAVGYAHAHGVIHRDLKPANVMVGNFGEVQVMDWGLAKVLPSGGRKPPEAERRDTDTTAPGTDMQSLRGADERTQAGSLLGTPAYMPPEQAIGAVDKVDRRSDVFALGAVLCAVLTGRPPYTGGSNESNRQLAALAKLDHAYARLAGCGADPGLVALCRRCLSPDPADRPADAGEVAAAVAELRADADERARRAELDRVRAEGEARRRRQVVRWAVGAAAVLLLGVAGTSGGLVWADAARRDAESARRDADDKRTEAETERGRAEEQSRVATAKARESDALVTFFEERVLAAGRPKGQGGGLGHDVTLREAVLAALPALADGFRDQPLVEARLRRTMGITLTMLGQPAAGAEQLDRARAIYAGRLGPAHLDTLAAAAGLTNSYHLLDRHEDARRLGEEVLAGLRRALPPDHPDTLKSMGNLATSHLALGRWEDARRQFEEVLAAFRRALPADHPDALLASGNLAAVYNALGRHEDARRQLEEVLPAFRRVLPPDHPDTLRCMHNLASSYYALGLYVDAGRIQEELLGARMRVLPADHPDTLRSMMMLALNCETRGRHEDAERLYRDAIGRHPRHPAPRNELGYLLFQRGDLAGAAAVYREAAEALPGQKQPRDNLRNVERATALAARLPAIRAGADRPASPAEGVELADLARRPLVRQYELAVRLYADAFAADPKRAQAADHRYNAACAAVRAAAGDDPSAVVGWDEWGALQDRAFGWLTAEFAAVRGRARPERPVRLGVAWVLGRWQTSPDLASVRDPARRAWMPAADRDRWAKLWDEVEAVRVSAAPAVAPPPRAAGR